MTIGATKMKNRNAKQRMGVMAPARNRTADAPTYQRVLTKFGFLPKNATIAEAWGMWGLVCEDAKVRTMAQAIEKPRHRVLASITPGYGFYGQVLSTMTARQLNALKRRVGIA